jgi:4-amino-4-deoxy-L-arabinose transferase-like glycosyltransferase
LLLIVLVAAALRLLSFQFSLPYVDHPDEPAYYVGGQEWRGVIQPSGYYSGIPPAYVAVQTVTQPILEALGQNGLASTVLVLRAVAIFINLATLILIALTARAAAGDLAGLIAGAAWGIAPLVLENGVYALPDPFIYFFTALAFWLAADAFLIPNHQRRAVWSVVAGLGAVLMKYPALPALIPGMLVGLSFVVRPPKHWRILALQIALIGLTGFWLVFIYGVDFNNLQREGAIVQNQGLKNLFDIGRVLHNLGQTIEPLNLALCLIAFLLGATAFVYAKRRKLPTVSLLVVGLALPSIIAFPWLTSTYSEVTPTTVRYVLPATALVCVLLGLAIWQLVQVIQSYQPRLSLLRYSAPVVFALLAVGVWYPQFTEDWALVQERRLPDTRVLLRQWFDANLDPGTVIVDESNHKTFNPIWGGIPHRHWVDWWLSDNIMEHPLAEWRDTRKMTYAVLPYGELQTMEQSPEGQAYLNQMLRLRDFGGTEVHGPQTAFYRLWRMQHETDVQFGDAIHLLGYDQSAESVKAGESITFRFYWKASQTPADNYSLFIHLTPESEYKVITQADGAPAVPERPALSWNDPTETLISPPFALTIPAETPAGNYQIHIGLYNYVSGERLPVQNDTAYLVTILPVSH